MFADEAIVSQRLFTTKAAAVYLSVSPSTVRRLYYEGAIPAIRHFKSLRFDLQDLDAFITAHKGGAL
jgi:excisionase family DNA binding protein